MLFRLNSVLYEPFPIANYLRRTVAVVNHSMQMQKKSTAHAPWSRCVSLFAVLLLLKLQTEEIFIHSFQSIDDMGVCAYVTFLCCFY